MAQLNRRVLEGAGHHIDVAPDGATTLEAVRKSDPDLLILDLEMPRGNGLEVLEELRADPSTADQPVVVLSSKELTEGEAHRLARLKVIDFLAKWKIQPALLVGWVRGWAAGWSGRVSRARRKF
ncbi:MAG: response regulator [Candidatus Dormibacteraeota bacterium]|nr:response regulator [Candidatus Dormibacteraeota bacterium]